jgi:N-hydroxyarylamine O-acetyltransferase
MQPTDMTLDLDAYFRRIGYQGSRAPTLDTLKALHFAQATTIPFENLDVLARRVPVIEPVGVSAKQVGSRRGGYCFELNSLFSEVLKRLGFQVTDLVARVRWMAPAEAVTERTHRLMLVDLPEGVFMADVGFGGCTMTGPLRLETGTVQKTPHEDCRLLPFGPDGKGYELQMLLGEDWTSIYSFTLEPQAPIDYELANWWTATHPSSIFTHLLIVARPLADRRHTLFNTELTVRHKDGRVETRQLEGLDEMQAVLASHFDIELNDEDKRAHMVGHFARWQAMGSPLSE